MSSTLFGRRQSHSRCYRLSDRRLSCHRPLELGLPRPIGIFRSLKNTCTNPLSLPVHIIGSAAFVSNNPCTRSSFRWESFRSVRSFQSNGKPEESSRPLRNMRSRRRTRRRNRACRTNDDRVSSPRRSGTESDTGWVCETARSCSGSYAVLRFGARASLSTVLAGIAKTMIKSSLHLRYGLFLPRQFERRLVR